MAGEPGAILIAGTGSIIFAKDDVEKIFRAGGFGRLIGDEGSGYSIGIKTLNLISRMLDGRKETGELFEKFKTIFHINDENDLISLVYNTGFDVASIAMFTIRSADENMDEAKVILDEESDELIELIKSISKKVNKEKLKLVLIGSLVENKNYYSKILIEKINKLKFVELTEKRYPPETGALLMAKKILSAQNTSEN